MGEPGKVGLEISGKVMRGAITRGTAGGVAVFSVRAIATVGGAAAFSVRAIATVLVVRAIKRARGGGGME